MEFAIFLRRARPDPFPTEVVRRHVAGLESLDRRGHLIAAGPLADGSGGLVLAHFDSIEQARQFARDDAYVAEGYETADVQPWLWAHRGNGYLDVVPAS